MHCANNMKMPAVHVENRQLLYRCITDLLLYIVLLIPIIICEFVIEPFRRGFFCNDETIRYPFRDNTITPVMLGLIVGLIPPLTFLIIELTRFYRCGRMAESLLFYSWKAPTWLAEFVRHVAYFSVGLAFTFDATELGKYTIGRLRPHFMAVCQPQLLDGSTCADPQNLYRYVEDYVCLGAGFTPDDVRQARLSFPSGHSSLVFYGMTHLVIYVHHKVSWRGSKLARYFLQFGFLMLAWFTALTRIIDNWHHWSDVLTGSLIGIVCALLTARYIVKNFDVSEAAPLRLCLPRQDTSTTLDEIIAVSTPPPYTIEGALNAAHAGSGGGRSACNSLDNSSGPRSFSNEQYCTKV